VARTNLKYGKIRRDKEMQGLDFLCCEKHDVAEKANDQKAIHFICAFLSQSFYE
jgi:hypothetical protein